MIFLLVAIALVGGVCITTIGPGGIFVTIALFVLLDLNPSTVAGTASATFIATGVVGSLAYLRSGQLSGPGARRAALLLSLASVVGAFAGAQLNTVLDARVFGMLLGGFVLLTGLIIVVRQRMGLTAVEKFDLDTPKGGFAMVGVGLAVGLPGGLLGVGGPVLAVPLMVVLGVPMLVGVALAQVQSIFISAFATFGYALHGAIDWSLAIWVGIPLLIGTVLGWYLAQRINPNRLKLGLAAVLVALGAYLLIGGGTPA
ncbi:MAG: sulfite exporter TauE/SafE family protein [Persicimonas sp.]